MPKWKMNENDLKIQNLRKFKAILNGIHDGWKYLEMIAFARNRCFPASHRCCTVPLFP